MSRRTISISGISVVLLLMGSSCMGVPSERDSDAEVNRIVFSDGQTIPVDLAMSADKLLANAKAQGAFISDYPPFPKQEKNAVNRSYQLNTGYDTENKVQRSYLIYVRRGKVIRIEKLFSYPTVPLP